MEKKPYTGAILTAMGDVVEKTKGIGDACWEYYGKTEVCYPPGYPKEPREEEE